MKPKFDRILPPNLFYGFIYQNIICNTNLFLYYLLIIINIFLCTSFIIKRQLTKKHVYQWLRYLPIFPVCLASMVQASSSAPKNLRVDLNFSFPFGADIPVGALKPPRGRVSFVISRSSSEIDLVRQFNIQGVERYSQRYRQTVYS